MSNDSIKMAKSDKSKRGVDKGLRRARDRFHAPKTQLAICEAITTEGVTNLDAKQVIDQLFNHLDDFKHLPKGAIGAKAFRAEVTGWCGRQARLIVKLRALLPEMKTGSTHRLFLNLPKFKGEESELREWVEETCRREKEGSESLASWMAEHQGAVREGIWDVLKDCRDLENCIDDVSNELFSRVWMFVADNAAEFLNSEVPLHLRLRKKAYYFARAWKTEAIRQIENGIRPRPVPSDGLEKVESKLAYRDERRKCSPGPIILGPGEEVQNAQSQQEHKKRKIKVATTAPLDLRDLYNPIIIRDLPWRDWQLERELRLAGPFRANDVYESGEPLLMAA